MTRIRAWIRVFLINSYFWQQLVQWHLFRIDKILGRLFLFVYFWKLSLGDIFCLTIKRVLYDSVELTACDRLKLLLWLKTVLIIAGYKNISHVMLPGSLRRFEGIMDSLIGIQTWLLERILEIGEYLHWTRLSWRRQIVIPLNHNLPSRYPPKMILLRMLQTLLLILFL